MEDALHNQVQRQTYLLPLVNLMGPRIWLVMALVMQQITATTMMTT
jgi:hypothetical protein